MNATIARARWTAGVLFLRLGQVDIYLCLAKYLFLPLAAFLLCHDANSLQAAHAPRGVSVRQAQENLATPGGNAYLLISGGASGKAIQLSLVQKTPDGKTIFASKLIDGDPAAQTRDFLSNFLLSKQSNQGIDSIRGKLSEKILFESKEIQNFFDRSQRELEPFIDGSTVSIYSWDGRDQSFLNQSVQIGSWHSPKFIAASMSKQCCLSGVPPHAVEKMVEKLKSIKFSIQNTRFMSLVDDSGTDILIDRSEKLSRHRLQPPPDGISSIQDVERMFSKASGRLLVLIAHVKDGKYVVRSEPDPLAFDVAQIRALAAKHNVNFFDIGCETATLESGRLGFGLAGQYRTNHAIEQISRILDNPPQNHFEFLERLTSPELHIVVDRNFVDQQSLVTEASIYQTFRDSGLSGATTFLVGRFRSILPLRGWK